MRWSQLRSLIDQHCLFKDKGLLPHSFPLTPDLAEVRRELSKMATNVSGTVKNWPVNYCFIVFLMVHLWPEQGCTTSKWPK